MYLRFLNSSAFGRAILLQLLSALSSTNHESFIFFGIWKSNSLSAALSNNQEIGSCGESRLLSWAEVAEMFITGTARGDKSLKP